MRKFINGLLFVFLVSGTYFFTSCSSESPLLSEGDDVIISEMDEINSFSLDDLMRMKTELENQGIEVPEIELTEEDESTTRLSWSQPTIKAIKVSTKTLHPNGSGNYIDVSGVLLVPKKTLLTGLKTFRIVVSPPGTYTYNDAAPSLSYKYMIGNNQLLSSMYFWILQAQSQVILIPDYPGFGDSYGQCFHPFLDSKALVNSTLDLLKAARKTLVANGYRYKKDISISGYSQGAFVATSLAREIETNSSHGFSVNLLVAGGTPCNLKYIADIVRHSEYLQHTYFLPYGLWGYKENAYPNINVSDFLLEPYTSDSKSYYDGTHPDLNEYFSHVPAEVYTEKFMKHLDTDPSVAYMNQILEENSVKPWKNSCRFIMTHGVDDVSVYFQNAKDFADSQNRIGGQVSFYPSVGDHLVGFVPYFTTATTYLALYR